MSIKVQSYVWENSKADGSALLLLLAIADHSHDDGAGAYPSVATLAAKCRQTERNTQLLLRKLEDMGEIVIRYQEGPHGCNIYQIPMGGEKISGVKNSVKNTHQISPEPSLEPSINNNDKAASQKDVWQTELQNAVFGIDSQTFTDIANAWNEHPDERRHREAMRQTIAGKQRSARIYLKAYLNFNPDYVPPPTYQKPREQFQRPKQEPPEWKPPTEEQKAAHRARVAAMHAQMSNS